MGFPGNGMTEQQYWLYLLESLVLGNSMYTRRCHVCDAVTSDYEPYGGPCDHCGVRGQYP